MGKAMKSANRHPTTARHAVPAVQGTKFLAQVSLDPEIAKSAHRLCHEAVSAYHPVLSNHHTSPHEFLNSSQSARTRRNPNRNNWRTCSPPLIAIPGLWCLRNTVFFKSKSIPETRHTRAMGKRQPPGPSGGHQFEEQGWKVQSSRVKPLRRSTRRT